MKVDLQSTYPSWGHKFDPQQDLKQMFTDGNYLWRDKSQPSSGFSVLNTECILRRLECFLDLVIEKDFFTSKP